MAITVETMKSTLDKIRTGRLILVILAVQLIFSTIFVAVGYNNNVSYQIETWHVLIFDAVFIFIASNIIIFSGDA